MMKKHNIEYKEIDLDIIKNVIKGNKKWETLQEITNSDKNLFINFIDMIYYNVIYEQFASTGFSVKNYEIINMQK